MAVTQYLHDQIGKMAPFVNYSNEVVNPLFIWYLKPDYAKKAKWTLYDLQDKLKTKRLDGSSVYTTEEAG